MGGTGGSSGSSASVFFASSKKPLAGKPPVPPELGHSWISNKKKLQALRQIDIRDSKIQV
jgi:hypothetical protein